MRLISALKASLAASPSGSKPPGPGANSGVSASAMTAAIWVAGVGTSDLVVVWVQSAIDGLLQVRGGQAGWGAPTPCSAWTRSLPVLAWAPCLSRTRAL